MPRDDDIRIRPGRIRSTRPGRAKSFVSRVLAATQKAGGLHRSGARGKGGTFGRGRAASLSALRGLTSHSRGVVIKARVVRHAPKSAPLATHPSYLQRDGVTRDGEQLDSLPATMPRLEPPVQAQLSTSIVADVGRAPFRSRRPRGGRRAMVRRPVR